MRCSTGVMPRPRPDTWPRVIVLVIVLAAALAGICAGYPVPEVIALVAGAGLAGAHVAQALLAGPALAVPGPDEAG